MNQADLEWAQGVDEISALGAALRQQREELVGRDDAGGEPAAEPRHAVQLMPSTDVERAGSGDWESAIHLVEAAAARIKAYERKFQAIEIDARAFIDRVEAEQRRLGTHIAALESDLRKAENRALAAEAELQAMKLETWEMKLSRRAVERKLTDAELEIRTSQHYLGQIEGILRSL